MKNGVLTVRRLLIALVVVVVLAAAYSAWLAWRTERDLRSAETAVDRLQSAVDTGDDAALDTAVSDLQQAAAAARGRTDGFWWGALTHLPIYGDDASGVEALSSSIDVLATDAVAPLVDTRDSLDGLVSDGRIDPAGIAALKEPVDGAARATRQASAIVEAEDSTGFAGALRTRYDDYARRISDIARQFGAAQTAVDVLPDILGADGPRDYFFIFQNNAEIRSTGGLPGSWAHVHVDDGTIELREQGGASDLAVDGPVTELTPEELKVYDQLPALFFQDPNFIPDFPRAAEIFDAFWRSKYPDTPLDGVVTIDPVGMSYLMAGTGPIQVDDLTLTPDNLVSELLSNTYLTITDPAAQDLRFQAVARAILTSTTANLVSPIDFVRGASRAIDEGRFRYAPFDTEDADRLGDAEIVGAMPPTDDTSPLVTVGFNDGTGSKMSYYLRYRGSVDATSCSDGVQQLDARLTLSQTISPREAKALPDYVTGGAAFGIPVGNQLVTLRIFGPSGGSIKNVRLDGKPLDPEYGLMIGQRPVVTVGILLDTVEDGLVTWSMDTGPGQTDGGRLDLTPSVVPGNQDSSFASAC